MATPITPPVTDTPTARTAEGVGTTATPTARTAVTPATTALPTARGAITPSTTPVPTARTSLTPATTAIPTARSAVTPSSNPTPTAVGPLSPVAALRTGGDVVNLDFCGESYNVDFDYSRASSGSYIGRNLNQFNQYDYVLKNNFVGDVENLALYSEQFNNAAWVKDDVTVLANSIAAPDKTKTADKVIDNTVSSGHTLSLSSQTVVSGSIYNLSVYAKAGTSSKIGLYDIDSSDGYMFDLLNGTILSIFETPVSAFMQYVGDGWYRCSISITAASTALKFTVYLESFAAYVGTGKFLYLHGAQATLGIKTLPYVKTLATAVTKAFTASPRIEYDAATGECLGYLAEGASTNLAQNSESLEFSTWTKANSTVISNEVIAPDGTLSGDSITRAGSASRVTDSIVVGTLTDFTFSVYTKNKTNNGTRLLVFCSRTGTILSKTYADIATGQNVGNGWYRIFITVSPSDGTEYISTDTLTFYIYTDSSAGETANSSLYVWGAQIEALPFATSYIRTEGSAVTRASDFMSVNIAPLSKSTLFINAKFKSDTNTRTSLSLTDGALTNRLQLLRSSSNYTASLLSNSVPQASISFASSDFSQIKLVSSFDTSLFSFYQNGIFVGQDTSVSFMNNANTVIIGDVQISSELQRFFGTIKTVKVFNIALTADEVKAL